MAAFIFSALKHMMRKPAPGLNKLALAEIYLKAGMPWRAIEALTSPSPSYRPDPEAERKLAEELRQKYPDWKEQKAATARPATWAWMRRLVVGFAANKFKD